MRFLTARASAFVREAMMARAGSRSHGASISRQIALSNTREPRRIHRQGLHSSSRRGSAWTAAVQVATTMVGNVAKRAHKDAMTIDPLRTVAKEMKSVTSHMVKLLGSGHPALDRVAKYYTAAEGKHMRPLLVLLMSRATRLCPKNPHSVAEEKRAVGTTISPANILNDTNPHFPSGSDPELHGDGSMEIPLNQRQLAEVTELIHTASLLHDDVIDRSEMRRGAPSANLEFGNKMTVLAGDFLLGRASVTLARLRNSEVNELMATVVANLIEGEFMQLRNTEKDDLNPKWSEDSMSYYLQKTYLKTASLISKSCRSAAVLNNVDDATKEAAYEYGRTLGLAFQLVDDMLDYTQSASILGKPAGVDLSLGLATAPLLFAWKQIPELGALVGRKFSMEGDAEKALIYVRQSDAIEQTRALAQSYVEKAVTAISGFPDSEGKAGLIEIADDVLRRKK